MCMTCRGKYSATVNPTTSAAALTSATIRRTWALVSPPGSAPESQHDLVAVDGVNVEMDRHPSAARCGQPAQQRLAGLAKITRAKRADAPLGDVGVVVFGPGVQPDQRDPLWRHDGRQPGQHLGISVAGQRRDGHRVIAGILTCRVPMSGCESIHKIARSSP